MTSTADSGPLPHAHVLRNLTDEAVLAHQLNIDFIGIGEHHRVGFAVSALEVMPAAIAARTTRIRPGRRLFVLPQKPYVPSGTLRCAAEDWSV